MANGDILSEGEEDVRAKIIENQLRGGILAAGGNRVLSEGTYTTQTRVDRTTQVTLEGTPALRGYANEGFVEVFGSLTWDGLLPDQTHYLYVKATQETYLDPAAVTTFASSEFLTQDNLLYLAKLDTDGVQSGDTPDIDISPEGKASAFNLFALLNNNTNPFGSTLTQSILLVLEQLSVRLAKDKTASFQQLNADATLPVISIENLGDNPEIYSSGELRLADSRLNEGFALTDPDNIEYEGIAVSLIGALNELITTLRAHIDDNEDPHGETLIQTRLVLKEYLSVAQLLITPPGTLPSPPGSPSPPPGPPPTQDWEIKSLGELRIQDKRTDPFLWSDPGNDHYLGNADSLIGALNELFETLTTLTEVVSNTLAGTTPAKSPITFEIAPDDVGATLNFRIRISEDDDFDPLTKTFSTLVSVTGWYYEKQEPVAALPPSPPRAPNVIPGTIDVPDAAPNPSWVAMPNGGLPGDEQIHPDGRPVRVQYRIVPEDGLYTRRHYKLLVDQYNTEYGQAELVSAVFG